MPEQFDRKSDVILHALEALEDGISSKNLRISERYIRSEINIAVRCRVSIFGKPQDFMADFYALPRTEINQSNFGILEPKAVERTSHGYQEAMLVNTVNLMDVPQGLVVSRLRLDAFEDWLRPRMDALYFSLANGRTVLLSGLADREIGISIRNSSTGFDQLPCEMIESASEVVDTISQNERNLRWNCLHALYNDANVFNLRVRLWSQRVEVTVEEGCDSSLEITDVMFGPFNLCKNAVYSGHGSMIGA